MSDMSQDYRPLPRFRFWCQRVLPLVYDNSLSYYEILCKVVDYINELIESDKALASEIDELRSELSVVQKWIADFNTEYIRRCIDDYIATFVMFGLTKAGYFVAYIPQSWKTIKFNTTGYDINLPLQPEAGHLVLSY